MCVAKHPVLPRPTLPSPSYHYPTRPTLSYRSAILVLCAHVLLRCPTISTSLKFGCHYLTIETSPAKPFNLTINPYLTRYHPSGRSVPELAFRRSQNQTNPSRLFIVHLPSRKHGLKPYPEKVLCQWAEDETAVQKLRPTHLKRLQNISCMLFLQLSPDTNFKLHRRSKFLSTLIDLTFSVN